jgi:hypothetical protein
MLSRIAQQSDSSTLRPPNDRTLPPAICANGAIATITNAGMINACAPLTNPPMPEVSAPVTVVKEAIAVLRLRARSMLETSAVPQETCAR